MLLLHQASLRTDSAEAAATVFSAGGNAEQQKTDESVSACGNAELVVVKQNVVMNASGNADHSQSLHVDKSKKIVCLFFIKKKVLVVEMEIVRLSVHAKYAEVCMKSRVLSSYEEMR